MAFRKKRILGKKENLAGQMAEEEDIEDDFSLPENLSEPKKRLQDYTVLLYGARKIGKTTMLAQAPNNLFLMTEPGGKSLRLYQREISKWVEIKKAIELLRGDQGKFSTVTLDICDFAYDMAFSYKCKQLGIEHPGLESDYGRSWGMIEQEFILALQELMSLGKGVFFVSHSMEREVKTALGKKYHVIQPTMPNQARRYILGVCDVVAYYEYVGGNRKITIRGTSTYEAGCRLTENFLTIGGDPIVSIPGGNSAEESYRNFVKAFHNKQRHTEAEKYFPIEVEEEEEEK